MSAPICWSPPSGPLWKQVTGRSSVSLSSLPVVPVAYRLVVGEDVPVIVGPLEEVAFPVVVGDQGDALRFGCGRFGHASSMPAECCLTATPALSDRVHGVVARAAARPGAMR